MALTRRLKARAAANSRVLLVAVAVLALLAVCVWRLKSAETEGISFFAVLPIAALAMMFGVRGGFLAAAVISTAFLTWVVLGNGNPGVGIAGRPLTFFLLGGLIGKYGHGALGDFDMQAAAIRAELRRAIRNRELCMHYQPIVDVRSGAVIAVEALARWEHPTWGSVAPDRFVPASESSKAASFAFAEHTIELVLSDAEGALATHPETQIWINISGRLFEDPELAEHMLERLQAHSIPASRIGIEVTETAMLAEEEMAGEILRRFRTAGIGMIAIDDFGTGYSSFGRLRDLPVDALKIDGTLVPGLNADAADWLVTEAIGSLAHHLGALVIAECIEELELVPQLREHGCSAIQGFGLSRPLPADEIAIWLDTYPTRPTTWADRVRATGSAEAPGKPSAVAHLVP